jgi:CBS domain-containing protein
VTGGGVDPLREIARIALEIPGSILLGAIGGYLSTVVLRRSQNRENVMTAAVGLLLLCIGIGILERMDIILIAMSFGVVLVNRAPRRATSYVELIRRISPPFYVMFFVLVGARLQFGSMPPWLWGLVAAYVLFRSAGKIAGAWYGATVTKSDAVVRGNAGLGLMAQGGVAIGLSVMASRRLAGTAVTAELPLAEVLVFAITASTFIVQLIGPPLTKLAVHRAGEVGRNVTEQDVIATMRVEEAISRDIPAVAPTSTLREVMDVFTESRAAFVPVVDGAGKLTGLIGTEELRGILLEQAVWSWMVAADISSSPLEILSPDTPLGDALALLDRLGVDQLPAIDPRSGRPTALLDRATARQAIEHTLISRSARHDHRPASGMNFAFPR